VLEAALELTGFDTTLDRHGISGGEDWRKRLGSLIRDADTVVFVLSPSSARSEVCAWEVGEAIRLGKRIVPVLSRPLAEASPPAALANLNYIFFYDEPRSPGSGFGSGLVKLVTALNTDLDWLREHTRYLQRASEWDAGGRPANRLLSGADIVQAKAWAARRPKNAPEPTAQHLDFIRASEAEESRQQSAEAQRLRQLAQAQVEREAAFADKAAAQEREAVARKSEAESQRREAEQALRVVRRTRVGLVVALLLAGAAGWFGWDAWQQKQQRTAQAFQTGWRALAGLDERSDDETYELCGSIKGLGGVRRIYCEVANVLSLQTLATLSGLDIFEGGPHVRVGNGGKAYQYNLRSHEIGRYNPAFVAWLRDFAVPAMHNDAFRGNTVALFERHVREPALNHYRAYLMLFNRARRDDRVRLTDDFREQLAGYTDEMERARRDTGAANFMEAWSTSPSFQLQEGLGALTGEVGATDVPGPSYDLRIAMSFWVRRSLDGTHREFFEILVNMLKAYGALPDPGPPADLDDR
jgi:TIR domain